MKEDFRKIINIRFTNKTLNMLLRIQWISAYRIKEVIVIE